MTLKLPPGSYVVNATVHVGDVHTLSAGICRLNQDDIPIVEYLSTINTVIPFVKTVSSAADTTVSVTCRAYQPTELPFVGLHDGDDGQQDRHSDQLLVALAAGLQKLLGGAGAGAGAARRVVGDVAGAASAQPMLPSSTVIPSGTTSVMTGLV